MVILLFALLIGVAMYSKTNDKNSSAPEFKKYTSQALKISFEYPKDWYVDDRYQMVLLTNYQTDLNRNDKPKEDQIKILISNFSNCFPTLEGDLVNPACGQGKIKNTIISKEVRQTSGGEFIKYMLDSVDETQRVQYFFRKEETILDIEKNPDPSQFEKEFDQIVSSIDFL